MLCLRACSLTRSLARSLCCAAQLQTTLVHTHTHTRSNIIALLLRCNLLGLLVVCLCCCHTSSKKNVDSNGASSRYIPEREKHNFFFRFQIFSIFVVFVSFLTLRLNYFFFVFLVGLDTCRSQNCKNNFHHKKKFFFWEEISFIRLWST